MYGLIHKAIRDCIKANYGEEKWEQVHAKCGIEDTAFTSMLAHDDSITFGLVAAACEELDVEPAAFMEEFGIYWVLNTARLEYGPIFSFGGKDLPSFLHNLDTLHEQVAITFANLNQPAFSVLKETESDIELQYRSDRDGLGPFVIGLLKGLGEHFEEDIEIEQTRSKTPDGQHDEFLIRRKR